MNDRQLIADGDTPTLAVLHSEEFKEEYEKLDEVERAEMVAAHESGGYDHRRPTARSRVQDVTATLQTIRHLVLSCSLFLSLKIRLSKSISSRVSMLVLALRPSSASSAILQLIT